MNPAYPSRYAWTVVALLLPVALLNYLDRQMLAAMKFSVMAAIPDIGSEANWGFLPAAFKWVYAFLSPVGGFLADRFGRRKVIGMSLFVWSAVTWATGHVHTFDQMIVTRALMGISEACYIPAALALIVDFHPGPTRSRAIGIHQMAIYIGIMIGGFSGYVADQPNLGSPSRPRVRWVCSTRSRFSFSCGIRRVRPSPSRDHRWSHPSASCFPTATSSSWSFISHCPPSPGGS